MVVCDNCGEREFLDVAMREAWYASYYVNDEDTGKPICNVCAQDYDLFLSPEESDELKLRL